MVKLLSVAVKKEIGTECDKVFERYKAVSILIASIEQYLDFF